MQKYTVPVVQSTFRILETLAKTGALGLNEITQRTGVAKSTVFRVLTTLQHLGYVVRDEFRNYSISHNLAALSNEDSTIGLIRKAALPHMLRLRDECGETVNLGALQVDKVTYLEVVPSEFALRLSERPGATVPVHASALGKAILAFSPAAVVQGLIQGRELERITRNTIVDPDKLLQELQRVRERGFAFDKRETSLLATCIGAPILAPQGRAVAAMSLSGPTTRFNPRGDSAAVKSLVKAVKEISKHLQSQRGLLPERKGAGKRVANPAEGAQA
jgi:DNA-binding IclR family transcriptional regulator